MLPAAVLAISSHVSQPRSHAQATLGATEKYWEERREIHGSVRQLYLLIHDLQERRVKLLWSGRNMQLRAKLLRLGSASR